MPRGNNTDKVNQGARREGKMIVFSIINWFYANLANNPAVSGIPGIEGSTHVLPVCSLKK
jgi:hypothetical protein